MTPNQSTATELQTEVLPPECGGAGCEGKRDDQLADITAYALTMFGDLADLNTRERVEILMVRHGWKQADVSRALGVTAQTVSVHWANICEGLDIEELPARQRSMMGRQCDAMYQRAARMGDPAKGIPIALKALELKAKLLGLNIEAAPVNTDLPIYTAPEEIAARVTQRMLELHGRGDLKIDEPTTKE